MSVPSITREGLIGEYVQKILEAEQSDNPTVTRAYLLELVSQTARAVDAHLGGDDNVNFRESRRY